MNRDSLLGAIPRVRCPEPGTCQHSWAGRWRDAAGAVRTGAPSCPRSDTAIDVRRFGLIVVLVAFLVAGCGGDEEEAGPARREPLLGVTIGELDENPDLLDRELQVMADSGVTTIRAPFYWSQAQPVKRMTDLPSGLRRSFHSVQGRPTSFARTDRLVVAAARAQLALLPVVFGTPSWAALAPARYNSPPADLRAYPEFLRALIGRYGPSGSFWEEHPKLPRRPLRDWQLWNEPDHRHYWSHQPYARSYVRLARAAHKAIKGADSGARVVMAGFADRLWDSITEVYRAGGRGVFDIVAIHPYTFEPRNVLRGVRYARSALRRAGDGKRPMWLTEVTWSSGRRPGHQPAPFETTPGDQAARLARVFPLLIRNRRSLGVERIYWESWLTTDRGHDNPFNFSGLRALRPDGTVREKPALDAFRRVGLAVKRSGTR
jgi:hypothetical protein